MTAMVQVDDLWKSFGDKAVLEGIDLAIPRGTILGLLGPNGAGKTTLVRILATLLPFDAGGVRIGGRDVDRDAAAVRRMVGLAGQYSSVDELLTGRENLLLFGRLAHLDRATMRRFATELLERFDLPDVADQRVSTYSGGMRRRLDLAAALIAAPPVLFLDEPTTGLDPRSRRTLWNVIRELAGDGVTILLTTQYLDEADRLADEIAVLDRGRLVTRGTSQQLKLQVGAERLELHLRDATDLDRTMAMMPTASLDPSTGAVITQLAGPEALRSTLNELADAGIELARTQVSAPTLEDVFDAATTSSRPESNR
jgi:ABC-2 type transport system ATP-binding protein